eukprot:COSAG05_NODE_9015_length_654_cov_1.754955_1_plen_21_part_01
MVFAAYEKRSSGRRLRKPFDQ